MAADLASRVNDYNRLRDELRSITNKLPTADHTQRPILDRQIAAKDASIREQTEWIRKHWDNVLEVGYRKRITDIVAAESEFEDWKDQGARLERNIVERKAACFDHYVVMRNAARAAGKPKPMRFDAPKVKSRSGQLSTWTPGLPT